MSNQIQWNRMRPVISGVHGSIASAHPLATQAGLEMLKSGGNAIDAVVTMAVTLGVVEPYMSGMGGVGFLLFHSSNGETTTLNFSGNTPAAGTPDQFTPESQDIGPRACLIPGCVAGWFEALNTQGTKKAREVFAPAVRLAEEGFPLHPFNVHLIKTALCRLNAAGKSVYGQVPLRIGAVLKQPDLASSLRSVAENGPELFYTGQLSQQLVEYVQSQDGLLTQDDLEGYRPEWETPISVQYRGSEVKTCPPNNEGFQILQTLKLLESFDLNSLGHNSADYIHLVSEAIKLAVADRIQYCADPKFQTVPLDRLLSGGYLAERRNLIDHTQASRSEGERWRGRRQAEVVSPGKVEGLTTHMAAVDEAGNVASMTQSLGNGFGSGVMVPGTGILLNNFVWWTEIDPACDTPNLVEPGKRWCSCMAPTHVFRDGRFWFSIATPGSEGILQTTLQMILNILEFDADPQTAIEAPRFRLWEETKMQIENRVDAAVLEELTARGHELEMVGDFSASVGGGQSVMIDPESNARLAGADPRRDVYAIGR
ncbi:MAG: gamma-glutamyltransferase [Planctomycetes bacterium]|nr:gamma-glutamyltransferase [Planctomycetota bacterium]